MKEKLEKYIPRLALIGLMLLIMASMFILNRATLLGPDDYVYSYVMGSYKVKVNTLKTILAQADYFYHNWTGRVLPHIMVGIFRSFKTEYIYDISNTLVFMIFITVVSTAIHKKDEKSLTFLGVLSVFGYFTFSKMFGEKFAWIAGALNYLWPSTIMAIFIHRLVSYRNEIGDGTKKTKKYIAKIVGTCVIAFLAGVCHENVAFVTGSFIIIYFVQILVKEHKDKASIKELIKKYRELIIYTVVFGIGALLNITAPGNFVRVKGEATGFRIDTLNNYWVNIIPIIIVVASIIVRILLTKNDGEEKNEYIKGTVIQFVIPVLVATIPMMFIGYFPPRAFIAYETLLAMILAENVRFFASKIENKKEANPKLIVVLPIVSCVLALIIFGRFSPSTLADIRYLIPYKDRIAEEALKCAREGNQDALVSSFKYKQWIHSDDGINISNFFPELNYHMPTNATMAQYYGFLKLTAIGEDEYLVEIKMDNDEAHTFKVNDMTTGENIYWLEYKDEVVFAVKKDEFKNWKLDLRDDPLKDKIKEIKVRTLEDNLEENKDYTIDDFVIKEK